MLDSLKIYFLQIRISDFYHLVRPADRIAWARERADLFVSIGNNGV